MVEHLATGGIEIEYEIAGAGPELVWLHGLGGNLETDRHFAERLATRYRVLWYSTRGCGRSSPLTDARAYGYDRIAADLDALLDHSGFCSPLLAGGSHGANTILRHEVLAPGRARGLLLVAPGANALARPSWLRFAVAIRLPLLLAGRRGDDGLVRVTTGIDPRPPLASEAAAIVGAVRTHDMASLRTALRRIPDQAAVDPALLARITTPVHVVGWARDPVIHPIAVARAIAAAIPGATFEQIERSADLPRADQADLLFDVVTRFDARLSA